MRRNILALATTLVAATTLALGTGTAVAGTFPTANGHSVTTSPFVALGDSYSSGAGVTPLDLTAPTACSRSLVNYAHDIAARTHPASFTDVTCSGAKTSDFFSPQAITPADPRVGPQLDAVTKATRLVTMTIGGNDENVFVDSFLPGCAALAATDPTGNPCQQKYGNTFDEKILTQTYPNVVHALAAVRRKAPAATVVILGYPEILPAKWIPGCTGVMPYAVGDVPWLHKQQTLLNAVIRKAAQQTGARFIDMAPSSTGHDACEGANRWIEPLVGAVNAFPVHPNTTGEAEMADQTLLQLGLLQHAGRH